MSIEGSAYGEFKFKSGADPLKLIEKKYKEKSGIDSYDKFNEHLGESLGILDGHVEVDEKGITIHVESCNIVNFIEEFATELKDFIPMISSGRFEYTCFDENDTGSIYVKDGDFFDDVDLDVSSTRLQSLTECEAAINEILQNLDTIKNNYPALLKILSKHGKGPYAGMTDLEFFAAYKE